MALLASAKEWARRIKRDVLTVYFAARDPRTPLFVRALAFIIAAYALSPIDLIPDFVPVLGYLDDLVLVPVGLILVIRFLPPDVLESSRAKAAGVSERPRNRTAAVVIVFFWMICASALVYFVFRSVHEQGGSLVRASFTHRR
jgi:uncharacterized membrane protein YkvA (DUF1232 family)